MNDLKIVVLDGKYANPGDLSWSAIEKYGNLTVYEETPHEDAELIKERIQDVDILITNKVPLTEDILKSAEQLKYVIISATGYNNINLEAANDLNILVSHIPAYSTESVVQHTLALLLQVTNQVSHYDEAVRKGRWEESDWTIYDRSNPLIELSGKTIGIIGFGAIGQAFGQVARQLGMDVLAYNRSENSAGREIANYVTLEQLYNKSDIISLHIPLSPDTKEMINQKAIDQMKDKVILINTSRGPLLNESDVAEALNSDKIQAIGVDVLSEEPMDKNNPLKEAKNTFITPHIAWATKESRERLLSIISDNLEAFKQGKPINIISKD